MGKKTQKQREDAFLRLLSNFAIEQKQNLPERVDLMAFFDLLDEHNVQVRAKWERNKVLNLIKCLFAPSICEWRLKGSHHNKKKDLFAKKFHKMATMSEQLKTEEKK